MTSSIRRDKLNGLCLSSMGERIEAHQTLDRMRMKKNKKAGIRLVWWKEARATEKQCYDTSLAVGENE